MVKSTESKPLQTGKEQTPKTLKELTLLDRFLFDQTMEQPEAHEAVLQIILGKENLHLLTPAQTEKELRTAPWLRSIRLDVYSLDQELTVYNTEMQAEWRGDLVKRSRYYQSLIDSSLLAPGTIKFSTLNDSCIIMITPFDLFGAGKYVYSFFPCCKQDKDIELDDGAIRIFLNTRGTNDDEVSQELIAFLHYVENPSDELVEKSGSPNLKTIHYYVSLIKASEEMGVRYMQRLEEELLMKQRAEAEGRAKGLAEGHAEGHAEGRAEGVKQGLLIGARNLIRNTGMAAPEALSALGIPVAELDKYLSLLDQDIPTES